MTQVFISYSRKDLAFVERLANDLQAAGLQVWYDLSGLDGGTRWGREIQSAIQQSQHFIVVLSPNSVESDWVEKEFMYAYRLKLKIIPLLYQTCDPPIWFINLHFIDVQGRNYEHHLPVILRALGVKPGGAATKGQSAPVLPAVQAPAESPMPPQLVRREEKPSPPKIRSTSGEKFAAKKKPVTAKVTNAQKPTTQPRRIKIRPVWIMFLLGLLAVIAFSVWGLPQMQARLASSPAPTSTGMPRTTFPITFTSTLTVAYTPTLTLTLTSTRSYTPTLTLTPSPSPTMGIGSQWTSPVDHMVMVYVPEGDFNMGQGFHGRLDELPVHTVYLDAFWIDKTEVTNRMYSLCMDAGTCQRSNVYIRTCNYDRSDNNPVTCVDWNMADTYCRWAGRRLPTEAEWEKAARGTDGRTSPWGDTPPTCSLANLFGMGFMKPPCVGNTTAVGNYPDGASPYGALDMAGNAWEWVNDWYSATYYSQSPGSNPAGPASGDYRVARGVSWNGGGEESHSAYRFGGNPADFYNYNPIPGIRCARTP